MSQTNKKYVKPDVEAIAFNMTTNIAGGCATIGGKQGSAWVCSFEGIGGVTLFISAEHGCVIEGNDEDWCYNNPSPDNNIFSS